MMGNYRHDENNNENENDHDDDDDEGGSFIKEAVNDGISMA